VLSIQAHNLYFLLEFGVKPRMRDVLRRIDIIPNVSSRRYAAGI